MIARSFNYKPHPLKRCSFYLFMCFMLLLCTTCKKEFESTGESTSSIKFLYNDYYDKVAKIAPTSDGGFIYCGSKLVSNGNRDGFLLKVDAQGNKQWYKTYGGKLVDHLFDVLQTQDGGYIAVGYTNSIGKGQWDSTLVYQDYVIRTNAAGDLRWERSYNESSQSDFSRGYAVTEAPNNEFYLTGAMSINTSVYIYIQKIKDNGILVMDPLVTNIDSMGMDLHYSLQKNQPFNYYYSNLRGIPPNIIRPDYYNTWGMSLTMLSTGQILMGGLMSLSGSPINANKHLNFFMKLEPNGVPVFLQPYYGYVRYYPTYYFDEPRRYPPAVTRELPDGYLMATYFEEEGSILSMQLIKTDLNGNVQWERKYKGLGQGILFDIYVNPDKTILLVGASSKDKLNLSYPELFLNLKATIIKVDQMGNEMWSSYVGGDLNVSIAKCVQPNNEGGYTVGAYSSSSETGYDRPFTYKISNAGKFIEN